MNKKEILLKIEDYQKDLNIFKKGYKCSYYQNIINNLELKIERLRYDYSIIMEASE